MIGWENKLWGICGDDDEGNYRSFRCEADQMIYSSRLMDALLPPLIKYKTNNKVSNKKNEWDENQCIILPFSFKCLKWFVCNCTYPREFEYKEERKSREKT